MTDLAEVRNIIQEEETNFKAGLTEGFAKRQGETSNHIAIRQYKTHKWDANGRFSLFTILTEFDGRVAFLFDATVIGYSLKVEDTGSSGTSTFDIHKFTGGVVDAGTIFSVKPAIANTAADGSQSIIRLDPASDLQLPAGHTKGLFSGTTFLAGEALEAQIDAAAVGARNASIAIMYRPT